MKLDFRCIKCGCRNCEDKNLFLPEKDAGKIVGFEVGFYYLKICLECGFTEMYSGKVVDKNEKDAFAPQKAPL